MDLQDEENVLIIAEEGLGWLYAELLQIKGRNRKNIFVPRSQDEFSIIVKEISFSLILTDIFVSKPRFNGATVVKSVKKKSPGVKVVVISGAGEGVAQKHIRDYDIYVQVPLEKGELIDVLT